MKRVSDCVLRARPRPPTRRAPCEAPITVCGLTALSVETSTNRSTPASRASSASVARRERVVADRLERVAAPSSARACRRRRGRRRCGACSPSSARIRCASFTSPSTGTTPSTRRSCSSRSIAEEVRLARGRPARAAPARGARSGGTSSEPIEPPAPVTSTTRPVHVARRSRRGRARTGSRPSRSSTCTSRSWRDQRVARRAAPRARQRAHRDAFAPADVDHHLAHARRTRTASRSRPRPAACRGGSRGEVGRSCRGP